MKLFPEELDILIADYGNNKAFAEGEGNDPTYAEFAEKRIARLQQEKAKLIAAAKSPRK